ncbi:SIR2 family protein [Streptomyces collinus]|uniref:SIR2 family protein n=1 Tax=Streptomyces collinus TaxID=42684 RepID=UPI00364998B3
MLSDYPREQESAALGEVCVSDDPEITEWPEALPELADAVHAGRLLVLTGAGVSFESGIPLAGGVVERLHQERFIDSDKLDYQEAMSRAFKSDAARGAFIRKMCYKKLAGPGNQAIALLAQHHGVGPLLTTNFDHLLEQACVALGSRAVAVSTVGSPSGPSGRAGAVQVLKLHGDAKFDMTAHSNQEMSEHHAWLTRWSQFAIDPDRVLLAVGHSGNDGPVRALVQDLVESRQIARVYWIVRRSPSDRLSSFARSLGADGGGRRLRMVRADAACALVGLYEQVSEDTFEPRQELLPGFQVVTGLYHGGGEIDPYSLRGRGRQPVVDEVRWADEHGTRLAHVRASSGAEHVFQSVVDASLQLGSGPRFVFSLDQAQQFPREVALSRSLSAWCARVLGRSVERSRLHLAMQDLPTADLWMIVNTGGLGAAAAQSSVELLERLAAAAPEGPRIWIISKDDEDDDGIPSAAGFSSLRLNSRSLVLPEESAGVLPHLRAPLSEDDLAQVLSHEGRGRQLDDVLRLGVVVSRGAVFVVDQTRWAQEVHHSEEHWMGRALAALRAVRAKKNAFERVSLDLDIERLLYLLAKESASPAERSAYAADALRELTDAAVTFASPEASLWFLSTLSDFVISGFGLGGVHGRMLQELVRRLEHVDYAGGRMWQGSPQSLSPWLQRKILPLYQERDKIISECLAAVRSGSLPGADAVEAAMRHMEARWPGSSYLLPGWMVADQAELFNRNNLGEYCKRFDLANQIAGDKSLEPVLADDIAEFWFTLGFDTDDVGFINEAFRLWEAISLNLVELGGIAALIHQCRYAVALYVCGSKAEASSLLFEAMSSAEYLGDEARVWRALLPLWRRVDEDSPAALWIKSWIHEAGEDEAGDVQETLERIVRERGELLEARPHVW